MKKRVRTHQEMIEDAAGLLIAVADDSGRDLVSVIADAERFIVEGPKGGDAAKQAIQPGRRGYTLRDGRLVAVSK